MCHNAISAAVTAAAAAVVVFSLDEEHLFLSSPLPLLEFLRLFLGFLS